MRGEDRVKEGLLLRQKILAYVCMLMELTQHREKT